VSRVEADRLVVIREGEGIVPHLSRGFRL
jgi:hypothetical protein